jgi:DNA polymerase-3 subunit delta
VLVSGPETFLAERAERLLRDRLREQDPSLEVHDVDAAMYAPGELLTLASPSLFGEPRLIRVANVEKCTDEFMEETLRYLQLPAEDTTVLLRHGGGVRGKRLLDAVRSEASAGRAIEIGCIELKGDQELGDFVHAEFRTAGRTIAPAAIRALVGAFSADLAELASACRQLIDDTDDDVTEVTVDKYYGGRVETTAFDVADAALAGRTGDALVLLRHALESGADPVPIVAAFALKLRSMAKVIGIRGGGAELAGRLGMAPWQVDRARRDGAGWSDDGMATAIETIAETDAAVKGAGRDPVYALERMVLVIAGRGE